VVGELEGGGRGGEVVTIVSWARGGVRKSNSAKKGLRIDLPKVQNWPDVRRGKRVLNLNQHELPEHSA